MSPTGLLSGRKVAGRNGAPSAYCEGCGVRLTLGEPKAGDAWTSMLRLRPKQRDLLLQAAAEYRELTEEVGEYQDVVQFLDWISVDVVEEAA